MLNIINGIKPASWPIQSTQPVRRAVWDLVDQCWSSAAPDRPSTTEAVQVLEKQHRLTNTEELCQAPVETDGEHGEVEGNEKQRRSLQVKLVDSIRVG
jgi:hypothetical protein